MQKMRKMILIYNINKSNNSKKRKSKKTFTKSVKSLDYCTEFEKFANPV